ncbi:hypothetical protein X975_18878, partial [Stegodyphus mimosarum]
MAGKFNPSANSLAGAALNKSCLLAKTSNGTPANFSSANSSASSTPVSSNRFLSALSITYIKTSVFSK